jgi:hypothetical protein
LCPCHLIANYRKWRSLWILWVFGRVRDFVWHEACFCFDVKSAVGSRVCSFLAAEWVKFILCGCKISIFYLRRRRWRCFYDCGKGHWWFFQYANTLLKIEIVSSIGSSTGYGRISQQGGYHTILNVFVTHLFAHTLALHRVKH